MADVKDTVWEVWRCKACDTFNEGRTVCETCDYDRDGNDTRAPHYIPPAVRAYITEVAERLPGTPVVLFSNFDGPIAYLITSDDMIVWDSTLGWKRGPRTAHLDDLYEFSSLHAHPDEVAYAIIHGQERDILAWYAFDVPEWERSDELPCALGPSDCIHGAGPVRLNQDCDGCTAASATVRARLAQLTAGYPVDVIA